MDVRRAKERGRGDKEKVEGEGEEEGREGGREGKGGRGRGNGERDPVVIHHCWSSRSSLRRLVTSFGS